MDNRNEVIMFKVGDLVTDHDGDIGIIVKKVNCDCWKVHYTDGWIRNMWIADIKRLLCSK